MTPSWEWIEGLLAWAAANENVRELWLFGSQATGLSTPESDVDLAIALMPASGKTDWALGNYFALGDDWQRALTAIVGRSVSLEVIVSGTDEDAHVRCTGKLIWKRDPA